MRTEEEKRATKKAYQAEWYRAHRTKCITHAKQYREAHEVEIKAWETAYLKKNKQRIRVQRAAHRLAHKSEIAARKAAYYRTHVAETLARSKAYRETHKKELQAYYVAYYQTHKAENLMWLLRRKYGLTPAQYEALSFAQGGICAICGGRPEAGKRLAVDHDHTTRSVRGLLCHQCNLMLGHAHDDPRVLKAAADYLRKFNLKPQSSNKKV